MNILFGTVIYNEGEEYLTDFFSSLAKQSDKSFQTIIVNENVEHAERFFSDYPDLNGKIEIIQSEEHETPVEHRIRLIRESYNRKGDLLILGDCDDSFSIDRVCYTVSLFREDNQAAFFYNQILDYYGEAIMPDLPAELDLVDCIMEHNFLGMSNTAINLRKLNAEFIESLNEYTASVFDWYFFSRLVLQIGYGRIIPQARTYYRLYGGNIAGIRGYSSLNIEYEKSVKIKHYQMMRKYDHRYQALLDNMAKGHIDITKSIYNEKHFWWDLIKVKREGGNSEV